MKKNTLLPFCLFMLMTAIGSSAQVGIGTTTPRGAFEINSSTNGFVPPQVALTSVSVSSPVVNPQTAGAPVAGTIVYNTATAGTSPNNVTPGYYFWNGTVWTKLAAEDTSLDIEEDLRVTLDRGSASNGAQLDFAPGMTNCKIYYFLGNNNISEMFFTIQLPHNWKEGTTIHPHIHWTPKSTGTGAIKWNLDYSWADLNESTPDTFPATTTISNTLNGTFTLGQHLLTDIGSGISATGKHASSILICRLWRNGNDTADTYAGDAGGISMDFHISIKNQFTQ
jgi:hypothetical protein